MAVAVDVAVQGSADVRELAGIVAPWQDTGRGKVVVGT